MSSGGGHLSEEPQDTRGAQGSRDTGSDRPSGGPAERPEGSIEGDESVPAHSEHEDPHASSSKMTEQPPSDAEPALPPYEDRQKSSKPLGESTESGGAKTGGATKPAADADYKAPAPGSTPGGATASPSEEQPAARGSETDREPDMTGPAHVPGTGRGENKL